MFRGEVRGEGISESSDIPLSIAVQHLVTVSRPMTRQRRLELSPIQAAFKKTMDVYSLAGSFGYSNRIVHMNCSDIANMIPLDRQSVVQGLTGPRLSCIVCAKFSPPALER